MTTQIFCSFCFLEGGLIIDVTRCSVALADPADLMEAFQLLTSQESQDRLGYKIVRFKNKFEPKSTDTFKNIMVNALVRRVAPVVFDHPTPVTASITVFSLPKTEISRPSH